MQAIQYFSPFSTMYKDSKPSDFFHVNLFAIFSTESKSALNYAFYGTHIENILEKIFWGHISTFCKILKPNACTKWLKITKNIFYKCVLEFNFASIHGSGLYICPKKVKIVVA